MLVEMNMCKILLPLVIIGISNLTSSEAQILGENGSANKTSGLGIKTSSIETPKIIDGMQKRSKENCGPNKSVENVANYFLDCAGLLVENLPQEMYVYGSVANSICERFPNVEKCMKNITVVLEPCLGPDEKENIDTLHNVSSSILEFVCRNEGESIANFIAADGESCLTNNAQNITSCAEETFGEHIRGVRTASSGFPRLPLLLADSKECMQMEKFRTCVIPVLKTCTNRMPSNVVDSVFDHLGKITPCERLQSKELAQLNVEGPEQSYWTAIPAAVTYLSEAKAVVCLVRKFENLKGCVDRIPYDLAGCHNVEMIKDCTIDLLEDCNAMYIRDAVDSMFGIIDHALRCDLPGARELLRFDVSHASSAGVVNIALMIVASTISASFFQR